MLYIIVDANVNDDVAFVVADDVWFAASDGDDDDDEDVATTDLGGEHFGW